MYKMVATAIKSMIFLNYWSVSAYKGTMYTKRRVVVVVFFKAFYFCAKPKAVNQW